MTAVAFHPELPIILTGSEDGTVKIWHASTYRLETTLNYGLERVWSIAHMRGTNDVGIGFDEGSVMIKVSKGSWQGGCVWVESGVGESMSGVKSGGVNGWGQEWGSQWVGSWEKFISKKCPINGICKSEQS